MTTMEWSPQQNKALQSVQAWLKDKKGPQVFRLFGFAGTGKTTLAKEIAEMVKGHVLYMCFTGKAALVLRRKGCTGASTIHSAIYKAKRDDVTGHHVFKLDRDSAVRGAGLVIVDEVSMVGMELGKDLLSFGTRILVLGDPFQLPPIKGEGFFDSTAPDVLLTEIHRQAADNPIIRMSMDVREGRTLRPGTYGESRVITRDQVEGKEVLAADQVIVGLNRTRQNYNRRIRELRDLEGPTPVLGDRLICLRNDRDLGLLNGSLWEPTKSPEVLYDNVPLVKARVTSLDDPDADQVDITVPKHFFLGTEKELDWRIKRDYEEFTFGWAITGHKSQGSQFDNVFVVDEGFVFREDAARWQYTAITRAAERVTVLVS